MNFAKTAMIGVAILGLLAFAPASPAADAKTSPAAPAGEVPAVFFPQKSFEFPAVIEGIKVIHDFVVMNKGAGPLVIVNVKTG
jgi:hypothetical protein